MENIYIGILLVLFILAISDLIVGVSNDAVNFLVSALGSKAAPFAIVMIVASVGVLFGATFSSGMMEVARKGIFHPDKFFFAEIMIIFVAVMLTDIILLDLFNTFGMPTSTTVSIVFELLGAAVALAVFKSQQTGGEAIVEYINTTKATQIVFGILLSVLVAFNVGALVQYISRILFSFQYEKAFRSFGAIWGGIAVTAITYFILIKGLKGASFSENEFGSITLIQWAEYTSNLSYEKFKTFLGVLKGSKIDQINEWYLILKEATKENYSSLMKQVIGEISVSEIAQNPIGLKLKHWVVYYTIEIIVSTLAIWTVILFLLDRFTKVNTLKLIVLIGTFALAMAFAGNDLVNFIGVPLAGLKSYQAFMASGGTDPMAFSMEILSEKVKTPTLYLLIAGLVMVVTLWMSKKARTVTETSINLSRQEETSEEQFKSSAVSRALVRITIFLVNEISFIIPSSVKRFVNKQLTRPENAQVGQDGAAAFDLIRASVNLSVASILISIGTSLKLPLSTTYVTFMVAMGTSLADGAWGRSTAVYRITGVMSVIMGWFITGIVAFLVAYVFATLIHSTGLWMVFVILVFVGLAIWRLRVYHKAKSAEKEEALLQESEEQITDSSEVFDKCVTNVSKTLRGIKTVFTELPEGLEKEDRAILKSGLKTAKKMHKKTKRLKTNLQTTIKQLQTEKIESGYFYVQVIDYLREITRSALEIAEPGFMHVDNNHTNLSNTQIAELRDVSVEMNKFLDLSIGLIKESDFKRIDEAIELQDQIILKLKEYRINHFDRIKKEEAGPKNSLLYLNILTETQNVMLFAVHLLKSQRDFAS